MLTFGCCHYEKLVSILTRFLSLKKIFMMIRGVRRESPTSSVGTTIKLEKFEDFRRPKNFFLYSLLSSHKTSVTKKHTIQIRFSVSSSEKDFFCKNGKNSVSVLTHTSTRSIQLTSNCFPFFIRSKNVHGSAACFRGTRLHMQTAIGGSNRRSKFASHLLRNRCVCQCAGSVDVVVVVVSNWLQSQSEEAIT